MHVEVHRDLTSLSAIYPRLCDVVVTRRAVPTRNHAVLVLTRLDVLARSLQFLNDMRISKYVRTRVSPAEVHRRAVSEEIRTLMAPTLQLTLGHCEETIRAAVEYEGLMVVGLKEFNDNGVDFADATINRFERHLMQVERGVAEIALLLLGRVVLLSRSSIHPTTDVVSCEAIVTRAWGKDVRTDSPL